MKKLKTIYQSNDSVLNDSYDRMVAKIYIKKQKENLTSFAFCGTEPGVGTTTIAINVAIAMAQAGWKTLLIDCDFRKAAESKHLNAEVQTGLLDYMSGSAGVEDIICATNYDNLCYAGSGRADLSAVSALCSTRMREFLEKASRQYDFVIADMPSIASAVDGSIISTVVDTVVLVTSQQPGYHVKAIKEARKQLDSAGAKICGIVVNRVDPTEYRRVMKNFDYFGEKKYITKNN